MLFAPVAEPDLNAWVDGYPPTQFDVLNSVGICVLMSLISWLIILYYPRKSLIYKNILIFVAHFLAFIGSVADNKLIMSQH